MYFIFSACSCMLDGTKFAPELLYEYDKTKYVACIPSAYFKTKSELITHLSTKFCIFEDLFISDTKLSIDDVKKEAIHDADAVTTLGIYISKRLTNFSGCCDPILIYNSEINSWEPTEIVIKQVHSEEDNKAFREGKLQGNEYIKRPLVPDKMKGEHRYLVPREFFRTWYKWDETNNDETNN